MYVSHWASTNIRRHRTKISRQGDLATGTCPFLVYLHSFLTSALDRVEWLASRADSGVPRGFNPPPPPKFRSFAKAEPNSQFRGMYIRNNLIRIWVSLICKLSGTPVYGATAPRSPFCLPSIHNWIFFTNKISSFIQHVPLHGNTARFKIAYVLIVLLKFYLLNYERINLWAKILYNIRIFSK
jgi:hypothetical protein